MRRMVLHEFGYGWRAGWHWDIWDADALAAAYLEQPRQALFVAVQADGSVVATTAVRADGPASPPHPAWLAARYAGPEAGQIARVWVAPEHRRRGLARALLGVAEAWALGEGYRTLCLHTDTGIAGAETFWRAMPVVEVHDARVPGAEIPTVHFEWALGHVPVATGPAGLRGAQVSVSSGRAAGP